MDCDGGRAEGQRAVENGEETVAAFRAVVHAAAELNRQRDVRRQGAADAGDNRQRGGWLAHQVAAVAAAEDFFHRAGEVQVDRVESRGDQLAGGLGELLRVVAHQLRAAGVVVVADAEKPPGLRPLGHVDDKLVQQDLAERVRGAQLPGDPPHRPVGVAAQRRLHGGKVDQNRTKMERSEVHIYSPFSQRERGLR